MTPNLIKKNVASDPDRALESKSKSKTQLLAEVPEESVWLANFISNHTKETYLYAVREFIAFHEITGIDELPHIDQAHIITWRNHLIEQGATPRTVNARISAVSSLFKHLCEKQITHRNPTIGVKRPKVDAKEVKAPVLTPEQVRKMIDIPDPTTLKGVRDRAILHILFYTGCRISEISSLKIKDFYEDGGYWVLDFMVKGGKRNKLAIHQELQIAITDYLDLSDHGYEKEAPLIMSVQRDYLRESLKRRQINYIFHKYARLANLPDGIRPHSARATFITNALENGAKIEAVQKSVGHAKINTTQMYDKRLVNHRESASFAVRW